MSRKNIIDKVTDDKFYFTPAYKIFIDFAREVADMQVAEEDN
jgi:hypothetical protein